MEKWKKIIYPPRFILIGVPIISFSACIVVLSRGLSYMWTASIIYTLSAYSLVIWIINFPKLIDFIKYCRDYFLDNSRLIKLIKKTEIGQRFFDDITFRSTISIYQGMTINLLYVLFRIYAGIIYTSLWFIAMAVYYLLLAVIRFILGYCERKSKMIVKEQERRDYEMNCYQKTGILMLLLNFAMGGMIVQMIWKNEGYHYPGLFIYFSAFYTFYTIIMSLIHVVRFRKIGNPILSASKIITLISAMMSILGLQTAMIMQFGNGQEAFRIRMNFITGMSVLAIVMGMAVYMIMKTASYKKNSQKNK